MAEKSSAAMKATAYVVALEVYCPGCGREDPIPSRDGSFLWDRLPREVTCPDCGGTFQVERRVEI